MNDYYNNDNFLCEVIDFTPQMCEFKFNDMTKNVYG